MASGFFQGGMAEGIESANKQILAENKFAFDQGIQSRTLALAEQNARNSERHAQVAEGEKLIGNYMTAIKDIATQGRDSGRIDQATKLIKPLLAEVEAIASITGRNPALYTNQIQAILSGPTPEETARAAGAAEAAKKTETARGLMDMGVSRESALESVGIKQPSGVPLQTFKVNDTFETVRADDPEAIQNILGRGGVAANPITPSAEGKTNIQLRTFKVGDSKFISVRSDDTKQIDSLLSQGAVESTPVSSNKEENNATKTFMLDGKPVSVMASDTEAIKDIVSKGGVETRISVQAANLGDAGGVTTKPNEKAIETARETVRTLTSSLSEVEDTAAAFKKNPEAGGISGYLINKIAGVVEQIPGGIGEEVTQLVGIDTAAVQRARTKAQSVLGKLIGQITGDTSGRYSDRDLAAAKAAIPALEATAGPKQIQAAYKAIHDSLVQTRIDSAEDLRVAAGITDEDMATEEGVTKMGGILTKHRVPPEEAAKIVGDLRQRLGIKGFKAKETPKAEQPKSSAKSAEAQPPMPGAKQARDGQWYIENPPGSGKWFKIAPKAK